ncbi:phytoene/squalene synthase family protein [Fructilactobacillus frigidiflavus]|uniref:phytoene/squalene synthase family protein n=1 Tax=Fructilactobacillus frigidiflavus TaxID=3242688 RepID=UPI00375792B6
MNREKMMASQLTQMEASEAVIKKYSSTFYYAFSKLPRYQSLSIFVIYDFLRKLDDAADLKDASQFLQLKKVWESVKQHHPQTQLGQNLQLIFQVFQIPVTLMDEMIVGQEEDLKQVVIKTQSDLKNYCFRVAGTVGLMIIPILTNKKLTASDQSQIVNVGIALQLTNIIRDVKEDWDNGYLYLPQSLLNELEVTDSALSGAHSSANLRQLLANLSDEAFRLYDSKTKVLQLIDQRQAKISLRLAIDGYEAILKKIKRENYDVLKGRQATGKLTKSWLYFQIRLRYLLVK